MITDQTFKVTRTPTPALSHEPTTDTDTLICSFHITHYIFTIHSKNVMLILIIIIMTKLS